MFSINYGRTAGLTAGITLLVVLGACADAPSAPARAPHPAAIEAPRLNATPSEGATLSRAMTRASRRYVRQADGAILKVESLTASDHRAYVVHSLLGANGLSRTVEVSRDGHVIARMVNDWKETASGYNLERQRVVRIADDGTSQEFDSQRHGGITQMAGAPIFVSTRAATAALGAASAGLRAGFRSFYGDDASSLNHWSITGPCDDKARSADAALDGWLVSVAAVGVATLSGNFLTATGAWLYEVKAWRDFTRASDALDQCVADAGKRKGDEF